MTERQKDYINFLCSEYGEDYDTIMKLFNLDDRSTNAEVNEAITYLKGENDPKCAVKITMKDIEEHFKTMSIDSQNERIACLNSIRCHCCQSCDYVDYCAGSGAPWIICRNYELEV